MKAKIKKFIYIHTTCLKEWEDVYKDVVSFIPDSEKENIVSVVLGDPKNNTVINPIIMRNFGMDYDEVITLQTMWNHARYLQKEEAHFYYLHLKGNTRQGEVRKCCDSWRRVMCHFMFKDIELNEKLLTKYDCLGSMLQNNPLHYQGNFFVTKTSHLNRLPYIKYHSENRYHETWVTCIEGKYVCLTNPNTRLTNLYGINASIEDYNTTNPWYIEQVKHPHGTTHTPITQLIGDKDK